MSLLEVMVWLLNLIERLESVEVGSLLFNDLMVFQYVFWFCLLSMVYSHGFATSVVCVLLNFNLFHNLVLY